MQPTPRRKPVRALPWVEKLEDRTVPTVIPLWNASSHLLSVVATADESITVTVASGNVKVNGADPGTTVAANTVNEIDLLDTGSGGSTFDVSGVIHSSFTALNLVSVTGGSGSGNTLIAPNLSLTWSISGADSGDVQGVGAPHIAFHSVGNLHGGTSTDDFAFSDAGSLSGSITGGSGAETLDFSACNNPVAVKLTASSPTGYSGSEPNFLPGGFSNIGTVAGGNGTGLQNSLTGRDLAAAAKSTWAVSGTASGAYAATYDDGSGNPVLNFSNFSAVQGGAGQNLFTLDAGVLGQLTIDLHGGGGANTFEFQNGTDLQGTVYGGAGSNVIDDTQFGGSVTAVLSGHDTTGYSGTQGSATFHDVNAINAPTGQNSLLVGGPAFSTWSLAAGTYSDGHAALTFTGFDNLTGGDGGNLFNIDTTTTMNLTGGAGADTFAMSPGATLTGSITGGGNGTISYAAYTTSVNVNLSAGTAPNVTGGLSNVNNAVGGAGDDTLTGGSGTNRLAGGAGHNTLIGGTGNETFAITPGGGSSDTITTNSGNNTLDFSGSANAVTIDVASPAVQTVCPGGTVQVIGSIQAFVGSNHGDAFKISANATANLTGGSGNDVFVFAPHATLTGSIDGGPGHDTLDYLAYTSPVHVNLAAGTADAVTLGVSHVENAVGPGLSSLIGDDTATVQINATAPLTNDTLTATATTADPGGEAVTLTYVWKVNGVKVKTTGPTSSLTDTLDLSHPGYGDKGQNVTVTVTPFDGDLFGAPVTSQTATVQDSPPAVTSVVISPARPVPGQVLTTTITAHDPDGDPITFSYVWLHNGTRISGATGPTLNLAQYGYGVVGDTITVQVTPSDGTLGGATMPAGTSLVASPPATFVIGTNHEIYGLKIDPVSGRPTGGYYLVSSLLVRSMAAGQDALGRTELFALGMDNQVYAFHLDGNGLALADCFVTTAGQVKALSATQTAAGNPEVFVIGTDNLVHAEILNAAGTSSGGYFLAAAGAVKAISATRDASGNPLLFTIGSDNQAHGQNFNAAGHASGAAFTITGTVRAIKAGLDATGNPLLMAIQGDGHVYGLPLGATGHPAGTWYLIQSGQSVSLNWCATPSGNVDLFTLGTDGQLHWRQLTGTGSPITPQALTPQLQSTSGTVPGVINDLGNDANLTGLTPALVDLYYALPAPPSQQHGRRNGP